MTIHAGPRDPVPLAEALRELILGHVDERARDLDRIRQAEHRGYQRGRAAGYAAGYAAAVAELKATQRQLYECWKDLADVERRRWILRGQPRTRRSFSQVHPDDYRGGAA